MRPEMCAMISWPFSSFTRNMVFGRVSEIVPSNSMTSSFAMRPGLLREVGLGRPTSRVFCHVAGLGAKFPLIGLRGCGQHAGGEFAETLRPRPRDGRLAAQLFDRGDEVRPRPGFRAEPEQVAVLDLCPVQRTVPLPQAMGEGGPGDLGGAAHGGRPGGRRVGKGWVR